MYRYIVVVACLLAAASLAPPSVTAVPSGLLSELLDKSICKSEVLYNDVEDRIPRIIKEVKCAANPDTMCPLGDGETSCCARNSYGTRAFACQEVKDTVLVSYPGAEPSHETVSVSCSCVMHQVIKAEEV